MRIRSCFFLALSLVLGRDLWADVLYSVTDLSTSIGSAATVRDINNDGQVVGNVGNQAYFYNNGQITYLGAFYASGMNDRGQVVGNIYSANDSHAVLYSNGQIIDLGTLGGSHTSADAVNNLGEVTGQSTLSGQSFHAFIYRNGQMIDIGTLGGSNFSSGYAINDLGQVVGSGYGIYAFLYSNGQMINLTLGGTGDGNAANAINNAGQVTGYSSTSSGSTHAFLYSNGQILDLGTLGGQNSSGTSINNAGQVVGSADIVLSQPMYFHADAFLYSNDQMTDLNNLIDPILGIRLYAADRINDRGQILVGGAPLSNPFALRPYLLTPVPEPSTLALLGVAGIGLTLLRVRLH